MLFKNVYIIIKGKLCTDESDMRGDSNFILDSIKRYTSPTFTEYGFCFFHLCDNKLYFICCSKKAYIIIKGDLCTHESDMRGDSYLVLDSIKNIFIYIMKNKKKYSLISYKSRNFLF